MAKLEKEIKNNILPDIINIAEKIDELTGMVRLNPNKEWQQFYSLVFKKHTYNEKYLFQLLISLYQISFDLFMDNVVNEYNTDMSKEEKEIRTVLHDIYYEVKVIEDFVRYEYPRKVKKPDADLYEDLPF